MCGERRRDNLGSLELLGSWVPCCHNCSGRIHKLPTLPETMIAIRTVLMRDRRFELRRLGSKIDDRVFPRDRRDDDRRRVRPLAMDDSVVIDDEMILGMEELAEELAGVSEETDELTRIRDLPLRAEPGQ